jgi:hypothetical protein
MQPIIEEIVNLTMWTVATGTLSLAVGVKLGSKLQRWTTLDEITSSSQSFDDGQEDGFATGYDAAMDDYGIVKNDPEFCIKCRITHQPCSIHPNNQQSLFDQLREESYNDPSIS